MLSAKLADYLIAPWVLAEATPHPWRLPLYLKSLGVVLDAVGSVSAGLRLWQRIDDIVGAAHLDVVVAGNRLRSCWQGWRGRFGFLCSGELVLVRESCGTKYSNKGNSPKNDLRAIVAGH